MSVKKINFKIESQILSSFDMIIYYFLVNESTIKKYPDFLGTKSDYFICNIGKEHNNYF